MTSANKKLKTMLLSIIAVIAVVLACFALVGCGGIDLPDTGGDTDISTPNDTDDNTDTDNNGGDNNNDNNNNNNDNNDDKPTEPEIEYTEGLEYEKIKNGEFVVGYSVVGIGEAKDTKIVIPAEYEEKPVTAIAEKAFVDCYKITEVVLPDTITAIESNAFDGCERLEWTEYGNVRYLGTSDNPYFALIREAAPDITSCEVHEDTALIAGNAFRSWRSNFDRVDYSGTIKDWCKITFCSFYSNPLIYAKNLYLNGELVTELVIPTKMTVIPDYAFAGISATKVVFPSGLKEIGKSAFNGSGITAVRISGALERIGSSAFESCRALKTVDIKGADGLKIELNAFLKADTLQLFSIESNSCTLPYRMFSRSESIKTVTLKGDGIKIDSFCFEKCTSLQTVSLVGDDMDIGSFSFDECSELALLNLDGIPAQIGAYAFSKGLKYIKFTGNKAAWSLINKDKNWMGYYSYINPRSIIVECTDGNVTEYGS